MINSSTLPLFLPLEFIALPALTVRILNVFDLYSSFVISLEEFEIITFTFLWVNEIARSLSSFC